MSDAIERQLAAASKGYMSKEEYKRKREELEQEAAMAHARKSMPLPPDAQAEAAKKKKVKKQKPPTGSLSFGDDLEGEAEPSPRAQPKKMGKCTNVDVSFLKKNEREEHEAALAQERAMREYLQFQQRAKQESITLNYTFRSEATQRELPNAVHRGSVTVLKGLTAVRCHAPCADDIQVHARAWAHELTFRNSGAVDGDAVDRVTGSEAKVPLEARRGTSGAVRTMRDGEKRRRAGCKASVIVGRCSGGAAARTRAGQRWGGTLCAEADAYERLPGGSRVSAPARSHLRGSVAGAPVRESGSRWEATI
eukprot:6211057-Pleurochrysis_carterae.AAC.1